MHNITCCYCCAARRIATVLSARDLVLTTNLAEVIAMGATLGIYEAARWSEPCLSMCHVPAPLAAVIVRAVHLL